MGLAPPQTPPHQLLQIVPPPPPPPEPVSEEAIEAFLQFEHDIMQRLQPPPDNHEFYLNAPTASDAASALYALLLSLTSGTAITNIPEGVTIRHGTIVSLMTPAIRRNIYM
jgi:hypothetical protein